jgi:Protein of unknown function (DUF3551)
VERLCEKFASRNQRTQLTIKRCSAEDNAKGQTMKFALSLLGALVVAAAIGTPAHADGPWCAFYDGRFGGASNCGFHTYEQCLATISGVGGWCQPNTMYVPPSGRQRRYRAYPY